MMQTNLDKFWGKCAFETQLTLFSLGNFGKIYAGGVAHCAPSVSLLFVIQLLPNLA